MRDIFIGVPTREEISLYLRQKDYSLLNMAGLRSEILLTGSNKDKKSYSNFFQDIFPEVKDGQLQEKTNRSLKFFYGKNDQRQNTKQGYVERVDITEINAKALRKLTIRNTQKNTGYRYVKLQYKNSKKVLFDDEVESAAESISRLTKVNWSPENYSEPHNIDGIKPILKARSRPIKEVKIRRKIKVLVEAKIIVPSFGIETDFQYRISK